MLFVVGVHVINTGALLYSDPLNAGHFNFYWATFVNSFMMVGTNCFILISGYFSIRLSFKRLFNLLFPCYFYAIMLGAFAAVFLEKDFYNLNYFPLCVKNYWFIISYFLLCLASPLLNAIVDNANKTSFTILLVIAFFILSVLPTTTGITLSNRGFDVTNFCLIYMLGRYINKYYKDKKGSLFYLWGYIILSVVIFGENVIGAILGYNEGYRSVFYWYDNSIVIISSICLFLFFKNLSIENSKTINYISLSFVNIYIIHSTDPIRQLMFLVCNSDSFKYSPWFPIYDLITLIAIFASCLALDLILRRIGLGKIQKGLCDFIVKYFQYIDILIEKYIYYSNMCMRRAFGGVK